MTYKPIYISGFCEIKELAPFVETYCLLGIRISLMLPRSKTLVVFICLLLIAFKVAASSIFIQAAIERAGLVSCINHDLVLPCPHESSQLDGDKQPVHTMHLMSHVTGNISNSAITINFAPQVIAKITNGNQVLFSQNFPDPAFKPPKAST